MNALTTTTYDPVQVGQIFAQSGMFPDMRDAAQCATKLIVGQSLGLNAYDSMSGLHVIKGKVVLAANMMAAAIKRAGKYDYRSQTDENGCRISFYDVSGAEPRLLGTRSFTMQDAQRAGLGGTNWQKYPQAMLFARCISAGYREHCPDALGSAPVYVEAHGETELDVTVADHNASLSALPDNSRRPFNKLNPETMRNTARLMEEHGMPSSEVAEQHRAADNMEMQQPVEPCGIPAVAPQAAPAASQSQTPSEPTWPVLDTEAAPAARVVAPAPDTAKVGDEVVRITPSFLDQYTRKDKDATPYWFCKTKTDERFAVWDSEIASVISANIGSEIGITVQRPSNPAHKPTITGVVGCEGPPPTTTTDSAGVTDEDIPFR